MIKGGFWWPYQAGRFQANNVELHKIVFLFNLCNLLQQDIVEAQKGIG